MLTHIDSFPPPLHEGNPSIWNFIYVLNWFVARGSHEISKEFLAVAEAAREINVTHQFDQLGVARNIRHSIAKALPG